MDHCHNIISNISNTDFLTECENNAREFYACIGDSDRYLYLQRFSREQVFHNS